MSGEGGRAILDQQVRDTVAGLRTWKRGERRAPHKPLLLLYALGRLQRGEPRLVEFEEAEPRIVDLLERFGLPTGRPHALYPFWYLRNDGLWEVPHGDELPRRSGDKEPLVSVVRERHLAGGFPERIDELLRRRPALVADIARAILSEHFPESLHEDILDAVGLDLVDCAASRSTPRSPEFREVVLRAYEHRCAICGFQALLEGRVVGVEAAHVKWHAFEGPAVVENGLALCILDHKLFDLGALGLGPDRRVLVSSHVSGDGDAGARILVCVGRPLRSPQPGCASVAAPYVDWHRREVFRSPPRVGA